MPDGLYLHSESAKPPLRIGLLIDDFRLIRVFAEVINHILSCDFAAVELVVVHKRTGEPAVHRPRVARYADILRNPQTRRVLLYEQYVKADARLAGILDDPLALVDCTGLLADVPRLDVEPVRERFVHRFPEDALQQIRDANLDVLIRFGFNILKGPILTAARYGVWSFHHGDNEYYRGGPALFWEIYENSPCSGVILQVLSEELDAGLVLSKAIFSTTPGLSVSRNRFAPYWGTTDMVIQKLRELHEEGWDYVRSRAVRPQQYKGKKRIYRKPTNGQMIRWLAPALTRKTIGRIARAVRGEHGIAEWRVGLRVGGSLPDEGSADSLQSFRWIASPRDGYFADPFLVRSNGTLWLFAEEYRLSDRKAVVSVCQLSDKGEPGEWRVCLEKPWHLSYPHVFQHDGEMFMVPETRQAGEVQLYRASRFPYEWKLETVLFREQGVDTTLWFQDGRWWCFLTLMEPRGRAMTLLLYHSESLTGEWKWHRGNPLSRDVRNARGAGAVFHHAGKLYRPTQDNSIRYGYSFSLREITTLNEREYEDRSIATVLPDSIPGMIGTHTYARCGTLEAIDGNFLPAKR